VDGSGGLGYVPRVFRKALIRSDSCSTLSSANTQCPISLFAGHEHECLIELFESVVGTFRITQPGSSVATSLVAGEAARKKVGILDIRGKQFRLHPVPLTQVRSFVTTEISLKQKAELDPDDPKIDSKVTAVLEEEVALMIMNAREKRTELIQDARDSFNSIKEEDLKYRLQKPNEVLVRIRVDHQGFTTLNNQRFGAKFVGEVANPTDILLFHRKKDPKLASAVSKKKMEPVAPDEMRQTNFEDVVKEELKVKDDKMKILTVKEMERAMEDYVDKNMPRSIPDVANNSLDRKVKMLVRSGKEKIENPSQIEECLAEGVSLAEDQEEEGDQASQKSARSKTNKTKKRSSEAEEESVSQSSGKGRSRKKSFEDSDDEVSQNKGKENSFESDEEENKTTARASKKRAPAKRSAPKQDTARKAARRQKLLEWSDEEEEDDDMMDVEPIKPKARPNRASSSREKPSYKDDSDDNWGDDDSDAIEVDDDEDDVLVIDEEEPKKTKRKTKKASKSTGKASAKRTTKKRQYFDDSSDEDYGRRRGSQKDLDDDWGTAATGTSGRM
jgi:double-strand break repair protein MRE11